MKDINIQFAEYNYQIKYPVLLQSGRILELLEKLIFTNYISSLMTDSSDYYSVEFNIDGEFYHLYKMAGKDNYSIHNVPLCNGGSKQKRFTELWGVTEDEEKLFLESIHSFVVQHCKDWESTTSYEELDKKLHNEVEDMFRFLENEPNHSYVEPESMGQGLYYYFGDDAYIYVDYHPLGEVDHKSKFSQDQEWFRNAFEQTVKMKEKQRNDFFETIRERNEKLSQGIYI